MSSFSHHEPCPKCGSKDNVAVYTDGGKHCFGCGYHISGKWSLNVDNMQQRLLNNNKNNESDKLYLPNDFDRSIPLVS